MRSLPGAIITADLNPLARRTLATLAAREAARARNRRLAPLFARTSAHLYRLSVNRPELYARSVAAHKAAWLTTAG